MKKLLLFLAFFATSSLFAGQRSEIGLNAAKTLVDQEIDKTEPQFEQAIALLKCAFAEVDADHTNKAEALDLLFIIAQRYFISFDPAAESILNFIVRNTEDMHLKVKGLSIKGSLLRALADKAEKKQRERLSRQARDSFKEATRLDTQLCHPETFDCIFSYAEINYNAKRYPDARIGFLQCADQQVNKGVLWKAHYMLGEIAAILYMDSRESSLANDIFGYHVACANQDEDKKMAYQSAHRLAGLYNSIESYEKAFHWYVRALVVTEDQECIARGLKDMQTLKEAMGYELFCKQVLALENNDDLCEIRMTLLVLVAEDMLLHKEFAAVIDFLRPHIDESKGDNNYAAYVIIARCYLNLGEYEKAVPLYFNRLRSKDLSQLHKDALISIIDIGRAYIERGKFEEALQLYSHLVLMPEWCANPLWCKIANKSLLDMTIMFAAVGQCEPFRALLKEVDALAATIFPQLRPICVQLKNIQKIIASDGVALFLKELPLHENPVLRFLKENRSVSVMDSNQFALVQNCFQGIERDQKLWVMSKLTADEAPQVWGVD